MATTSTPNVDIRLLEEELHCSICCDLLKEPKDLDCQHIFCLECLQKWVKSESTIECPECRHITIVPRGGLLNLKTNLRLKAMVEKCAEHTDAHKGVPLCPDHKGERQHFFCVTCGVTVCRNCLVLQHERPYHKITELKVITKQPQETMTTKLGHVGLKEELQKIENAEKKLYEMERKLQESQAKAQTDIKAQSEKLIAEVKAQEIELLDCVDDIFEEQMKTVSNEQRRISENATRLQNLQSAAQSSFDTSSDHIYANSYGPLENRMYSLSVTEHELPSIDVTALAFSPGSGCVKPLFGEVGPETTKTDVNQSEDQGNRNCKLTLMTEFGEFRSAQGVAITQTGILAVVEGANQVFIYHEHNGQYKRQFSLSSSTSHDPYRKADQPYDVAVISQGHFLVVYNLGVVKMYRSTDGKYMKTLLTKVGNSIATTPDDMIVVGGRGVITVHQPDGKLIRTHQVKCQGMRAIASNGKQIAFTPYPSNKLCVIDFVTGDGVWSAAMNDPCGVCYDYVSNTILVSQYQKPYGYQRSTITQYCSTTGRRISSQDTGLTRAYSMTVTADRRFVVADREIVKVYTIDSI